MKQLEESDVVIQFPSPFLVRYKYAYSSRDYIE